MSGPPWVLNYAKPNPPLPLLQQTEVRLTALADLVLGAVLIVGRCGGWTGIEGVAVGLLAVIAALIPTLSVVAAAGVYVAYVDGPTSPWRKRTAWVVFGITLGNLALLIASFVWAVRQS